MHKYVSMNTISVTIYFKQIRLSPMRVCKYKQAVEDKTTWRIIIRGQRQFNKLILYELRIKRKNTIPLLLQCRNVMCYINSCISVRESRKIHIHSLIYNKQTEHNSMNSSLLKFTTNKHNSKNKKLWPALHF